MHLRLGISPQAATNIEINFEIPKELRKKVGCPSLISLLKENKRGRRMLPRLYMSLSDNSMRLFC